jgi:hypothetical protein
MRGWAACENSRVGAYDTYTGSAHCPTCGDVHYISNQTKFFDPDYHTQRWFEPGIPLAIDLEAVELIPNVRDSWWRVRDPVTGPERLTLLADIDDLFGCSCGTMFAVVVRFELAAGHVTMLGIELLDIRTDISGAIDFADGEPLWRGEHARFDADLAALAASPFAHRRATLRRWIDERFAAADDEDTPMTWTTLTGPTRCEACGNAREREHATHLGTAFEGSCFFGPGWQGGPIYLGSRIPFDSAWLADDVDRGYCMRARHPVPDTHLTILGVRLHSGCRCGAGRASVVQRYARHDGELELVDLSWRAMRDRSDLVGIDFLERESRRWHDVTERPLRSREDILREVVNGYRR